MLIGLTGGIGSGKSTVAKMFLESGIPIVDADLIAREVVEPEKEAWKQIVQHFGEGILLEDQTIDRKKLGAIIFHKKEQRETLNKITHPIIIKEILRRAKELEKACRNVIVDIPLLYESHREPLFDVIIVVYVKKSVQIKRLMERDNLDEMEALNKIEAQMSLDEKRAKADIVIYNEEDRYKTKKQVEEIIDKLDKGWNSFND